MNTTPLFSSARDAWNTPPDLVREIVAFLGTIDLDPCPDMTHAIPAMQHAVCDGLAMPWRGRVYVNPPYGRQIGRWVTKALTEPVDEVVLLVPARVDTSWFQPLFALPICFVRGRLRFSEASSGAPFPSALVYRGVRVADFVQAFASRGVTVRACVGEEVRA